MSTEIFSDHAKRFSNISKSVVNIRIVSTSESYPTPESIVAHATVNYSNTHFNDYCTHAAHMRQNRLVYVISHLNTHADDTHSAVLSLRCYVYLHNIVIVYRHEIKRPKTDGRESSDDSFCRPFLIVREKAEGCRTWIIPDCYFQARNPPSASPVRFYTPYDVVSAAIHIYIYI